MKYRLEENLNTISQQLDVLLSNHI